MTQYLDGWRVIISPAMTKGYEQRRRHKKRRINKKWEKAYGYRPIYDMEHMFYNPFLHTVMMSEGMWKEIKQRAIIVPEGNGYKEDQFFIDESVWAEAVWNGTRSVT